MRWFGHVQMVDYWIKDAEYGARGLEKKKISEGEDERG